MRIMSAAAAAIALVMLVVYLAVIQAQEDSPAVWFVVALAVAGLLAAYGASRRFRPALLASGALLLVLGLLGILTIGLPLIVAGALAIAAAVRRPAPAP
jgi:hypothetical protein